MVLPCPSPVPPSAALARDASSSLPSAVAPAMAAPDAPTQRVQTVLPPGNSMLYTADGVAAGNATGDPDDYGPWTDDQREMYWDYEFKDGTFVATPDDCAGGAVDATDRAAGLEAIAGRATRICWSDHGVPAVFGDTAEDLFYGSGWVAGEAPPVPARRDPPHRPGNAGRLAGEGVAAPRSPTTSGPGTRPTRADEYTADLRGL